MMVGEPVGLLALDKRPPPVPAFWAVVARVAMSARRVEKTRKG